MAPEWEEVEPEVRRAFRAGRRVDAWALLQPHLRAGLRHGTPGFLQTAHDVCWWLGFESHRFWVGRRGFHLHQDKLWAWSRRTFDFVRKGQFLAAWQLQQRTDRPIAAGPEELAQAEIATARTLTYMRDFRGASAALDRAEQAAGESPATARERCYVALESDDPVAALAGMARARARWPEDPFLRESECMLLMQHGQCEQAEAALAAATAVIQCPSLDLAHADLLFELGRHEVAKARLEEIFATRPLSRQQRGACSMLLARVRRTLGDDAGAIEASERGGRSTRKWAERLRTFVSSSSPGTGRRVLSVPYVRQDHVTCSPATMTSLLRSFGVAAEQREIAAEITYDGTPSHAELQWARSRGLEMWFFQFDHAVARELIDLGLPFAVSTRFEQSGHRQALVGYDLALGTYLLRDPGQPILQEVDAEWLAKNLTSRGGDCALILPASERHRAPEARLPHAEESMLLQELRAAYERRDLAAADGLATKLLAAPESNVQWEAASRIAYERGDRRRRLELWQTAYERHQDDPYWQYQYALELRSQDRWGAFVALLQRHIGGRSPYLAMLLADHLRHAAGTRDEAAALARRAVRLLPRRSGPVKLLADVLWDDPEQRRTAASLYQLASFLEPFDEGLADSFFLACRHLGEEERGFAHLRERAATLGTKRSGPGATLARALDLVHRRGDAIATLRQALATHENPETRVQLFDLLLADGQRPAAAALLDEGDSLWRPLAAANARRRLAEATGDRAAAAAALDAAVAIDPSDAGLCLLHLRETLASHGRDAALAEAQQVIAAHGDDPQLLVSVQGFFSEVEALEPSERLLRRLADEHPHEWWLQGRLGRFLLRCGRAREAAPMIERLLVNLPDSLAVWLDAIDVAEELGDLALARQRADQAAVRWAAETSILQRRRSLAESAAQSAAAIEQAMAAMRASHLPPAAGDLEHVVAVAGRELDKAAVKAFLEALHERFQGAPEVAAARCRWLLGEDPAAAVEMGGKLLESFPWIRDHWLLQASCLRVAGRRREERELLERHLAAEPSSAQAWIDLGESLEQEGRTQEAMATYDRGLAHVPSSPVLHGMRGNLLWTCGDRAAALAAVDRAALLDRAYGWARRAQVLWRIECGQEAEALAAAQACVRDNPLWSFSHELLASAHAALGNHDERIAALQQAVRCDPRVGAARRRLLDALLDLRRYDAVDEIVADGLRLLGEQPWLRMVPIRVRRQQGQLAAARADLRALLEAHADYEDGWIDLLTWLEEEGLDDEILTLHGKPPAALAKKVALLGHAADVFRRRGDLRAFERTLRQALEIAPDYEWARDNLASTLLLLDKPRSMLELFPGADDPARLPFHRAGFVARALAATGKRDAAARCFERMLQEPAGSIDVLAEADQVLLRHQRGHHRRLVRDALRQSEAQHDARRHENCLLILALRGERSFWTGLTRFQAWQDVPEHEVAIARLLYGAQRRMPKKVIAGWVQRHLSPPIEDTEAWGRILFALCGRHGARAATRLTAGNFRRPGVRGWMLANLVAAHAELRDWAAVREIAHFALREVPLDHSMWWHQRFLAEAAYWDGEFAVCRELCVMDSEEFPSVKVKVLQFAALAELATTRGWWARRRVLRAALPAMLEQAARADEDSRGGTEPTRLDGREFLRLVPSPTTLLLALGVRGRKLLTSLRR